MIWVACSNADGAPYKGDLENNSWRQLRDQNQSGKINSTRPGTQ